MHDYQIIIDQLRESLDVDFIGLAMPSDLILQADIHWRYVSCETNETYKKIELKKEKASQGLL